MSQPTRFGRYEVQKPIGRGAMGMVYLAVDPVIGREVAIKVIQLADGFPDAERLDLRSRFEREFRSAGTLVHPNIVTIYDVGDEGGVPFIAMEYVAGGALEAVLGAGRAFTDPELADLVRGIASGLDHAHQRGIVHRDVKPANILLTADGRPKIADFGVARLAESGLTRTGTVVGTPWYMAPEQITGQPVSGVSDQFSLAVMVYQMLTGERPFTGERSSTVLYKIVHTNPVSARVLNQRLSAELDAVLLRALDKSPDRRYPSCTGLAQALAGALGVAAGSAVSQAASVAGRGGATAGSPPAAAPPSREDRTELLSPLAGAPAPAAFEEPAPQPPGELRRPAPSASAATPRRRIAVVALAAVALGAALGAGFWVLSDRAEETAPSAQPPPAAPLESAPPRMETFRVTSRPAGARLTLDGSPLERPTPAEISLDLAARHTLLVEHEGYEEAAFSFFVEELGEEQRRSRTLFFPLRALGATAPGEAPAAAPTAAATTTAVTGAARAEPNPPAKSARVRAGQQVEAPRRLIYAPPEIPPGKTGREGVVVLELTIDPEGNVVEAKVLRGLDPDLDAAAVAAARRWRYEPTVYRGRPATVILNTTVRFPPQ